MRTSAKHCCCCCKDLTRLSKLVLGMHQQQQVTWLGGISNHEDIFQPLYRALLALHTAASSQWVLKGAVAVAGNLPHARACLQQVDLNPVLSELLVQTVDRWAAAGRHEDAQEPQVS